MDLMQSRNLYNEWGYLLGVLVTFWVCPIFSLPFIVSGMLHDRRTAYFAFAVFMGLLAYMLAPVADLASYAYMYYKFEHQSLENVFIHAFVRKDFVMHSFLWLFAHLGIPFGYFKFSIAFISFLILNHIFLDKIQSSLVYYSPGEVVCRYFCYIAVFPFILLVGGVRFGFATIIMIYGFYLYIDRSMKILGVLIALCASFIHYSLLYFALFAIFVIQIRIERKVALLLLALMAVFSLALQNYVQQYLVSNEVAGVDYLGDGVWGRQVGQSLKITALVYHWGQRLFFVPLLIIFFRQYDKKYVWGRLFFSFLLMFSILYSAFTLAQRLTVIISTISIFIYLEEEIKGYVPSKRYGLILLFSCLMICAFDLYTHREQILLSNYWRLCQPVPITLTQEYDKEWLFINSRDRFM